jgi:hypothetical protein
MSLGLAVLVVEDLLQRVKSLHQRRGEVQQPLAVLGEAHVMAFGGDELHTVVVLKRPHLPPDRGRGHAETPRRRREGAVPGDFKQGADLAEPHFLKVATVIGGLGTAFGFHCSESNGAF